MRLEGNIRRIFFVMSGLFIAAIVLFTVLSAQWFRTKGEINDLNDELSKLAPTVKKIQDFDSKTATLTPKINLYGEARAHTLRWYSYLQVVAHSLPDHTWLTRIATLPAPNDTSSSQASVPNTQVTLGGVTMSQQLVGDTMLRLNSYRDLLNAVQLHYTQKGQVGKVPTVEFEVGTDIKDLAATFTGAPDTPSSATKTGVGGADANQTKS